MHQTTQTVLASSRNEQVNTFKTVGHLCGVVPQPDGEGGRTRRRPPCTHPHPLPLVSPCRQTNPRLHWSISLSYFSLGYAISNKGHFMILLPSCQKTSLFSKCLKPLVKSFTMFIFRINMPQAEIPSLPSVSPWDDSRKQTKGEWEETKLSRRVLTMQRRARSWCQAALVPPLEINTSLQSLPSQAVGNVPPSPASFLHSKHPRSAGSCSGSQNNVPAQLHV